MTVHTPSRNRYAHSCADPAHRMDMPYAFLRFWPHANRSTDTPAICTFQNKGNALRYVISTQEKHTGAHDITHEVVQRLRTHIRTAFTLDGVTSTQKPRTPFARDTPGP
jgi:hypothetical protein